MSIICSSQSGTPSILVWLAGDCSAVSAFRGGPRNDPSRWPCGGGNLVPW
jgi:hypothetical protein